jgi:hypothetical protein
MRARRVINDNEEGAPWTDAVSTALLLKRGGRCRPGQHTDVRAVGTSYVAPTSSA